MSGHVNAIEFVSHESNLDTATILTNKLICTFSVQETQGYGNGESGRSKGSEKLAFPSGKIVGIPAVFLGLAVFRYSDSGTLGSCQIPQVDDFRTLELFHVRY